MESRCEQCVFIGYDKNSPAYLVYNPNSEKVQRYRLVKFTTKMTNEKGTQTAESQIMGIYIPRLTTLMRRLMRNLKMHKVRVFKGVVFVLYLKRLTLHSQVTLQRLKTEGTHLEPKDRLIYRTLRQVTRRTI